MKTRQWIGIMIASLAILSGCTNNRGVIEHPAFIAKSAYGLEIEKIELSDTATILYFKAFFNPGNWIKPDPNGFLKDNKGNKYNLLSAEGISLEENFIMPESGETEFSLIFQPVASNAVYVDFSEGDYSNAWNIWGIQLTNQPLKVKLPRGFKDVTIDKNAVLPPVEFKEGKAKFEGQILNYHEGMPATVSVFVVYPFESSQITFPVDPSGKFSGEIDAFSVHPATVGWSGGAIQCFIAPAETTKIILNPAEMSRRSSRISGDSPSLGESAYFGGCLASLSKELAGVSRDALRRQLNSYESFMAFLQSIGSKTPEELKTFFLDEYKERKLFLEELEVSPACKQILNSEIEISSSSDILNIKSWIDQAYVYNNQLQNDREAVMKYYATRKIDIPDDFYDVLKEFPSLNDPMILYNREIFQLATQWQAQNMQSVLNRAFGDQGIIFDIMNVSSIYRSIKDFKFVSEEQIEQLPSTFRELIRNKNNELLQLIEANKNKTGFTANDIKDVANEDIFPFITSKFRGKPILLDVWATWCGPCIAANKEMKPIKAELAGKDIVYVFVAGDNSPLETWENMIPDLPGEHFRLSADQWSYFTKTFGVNGVPSYFFIDREGNIKEKFVGYPGNEKVKGILLDLLGE